MISLRVGECAVDILPVVNGIASEAQKVKDAFGRYEAYGVSLGIEGVQALRRRGEIADDMEVSELDLVYAEMMTRLTGEEVVFPSPAMCEIVDLAEGNVIALDMNDEQFTEMYCDTVSAWDFTREHRVAKKGMKQRFSSDTPEGFAREWDAYVGSVKGYRKVSENRERHIAAQIRDTAWYRKSLLAVIEVERTDGVADLLRRSRAVVRVPFIRIPRRSPCMACDSCERAREAGMSFCPECGDDLREDCPRCAEYRAAGRRYCASCGKRLEAPASGPEPTPPEPPRRQETSVLAVMTVLAAPLAAVILFIEAGAMLAGTGIVWDWCADHSMNILGLVPNLVVLTTIRGTALQIAWILIEIAVILSLGCVLLRSWRTMRSEKGTLVARAERTDLCRVAAVYSVSLVFDIVIALVSASAGHGIEVPDELTTGFHAEALLSYADAGVWEEVISRVVPMGVPMTIAALIMRRKDAWRCLLGGFGMSRLTLILILVSALMFGFAHSSGWGLSKVAPTFVAGLLFGYLYAKVGVHATIAMHFLTDYLAVIAYTDYVGLTVLVSLATLAFIADGAVCILRWVMRAGEAKDRLKGMPNWVPPQEESIFSRRGSDWTADSSVLDSMIQFPR